MNVEGVDDYYDDLFNVDFEYGRFFTPAEVSGGRRVAILGWQTARDLFGESNPVGETINIENHRFEVIGVVEEQGGPAYYNGGLLPGLAKAIVPIGVVFALTLLVKGHVNVDLIYGSRSQRTKAILDVLTAVSTRPSLPPIEWKKYSVGFNPLL